MNARRSNRVTRQVHAGAVRGTAGFTLIEMIVVVVIMSVLAGVGLLAMNRVDPSSGDGCSDALDAWLAAVKDRSAREDESLYVAFGPDGAVAARLVTEQDDSRDESVWRTRRVMEHETAAECRFAVHDSGKDAPLPALDSYRLAVTSEGIWSTLGGDAAVKVEGKNGAARRLELGDSDKNAR